MTPDSATLDRLATASPIVLAAAKVKRLYPGVIGEVLAGEILALLDFRWLGPESRSARLYRLVESMPDAPRVASREPVG